MSITIATQVFCDECVNWLEVVTGPRPAARLARKKLRKKGWARRYLEKIGKVGDVCPDCMRLRDGAARW